MATISEQKSNLLQQFNETRTRTLNLVQTLEKEMIELTKYDDILNALEKYFSDDTKKLTLNE